MTGMIGMYFPFHSCGASFLHAVHQARTDPPVTTVRREQRPAVALDGREDVGGIFVTGTTDWSGRSTGVSVSSSTAQYSAIRTLRRKPCRRRDPRRNVVPDRGQFTVGIGRERRVRILALELGDGGPA
jgi:hypothetical protein